MREGENQFKISVTMAIYNVEDYIDEAMESLINQTIGFENIQVVMVDDCSTDGTRTICRQYARKYPQNIVYIEKENNSGAADTRNIALQKCTGEITTSVDPDDYVDLELFENAYDYYQEVKSEVDVVAVPLHFFGDAADYHIASKYRYYKTRIVDIENEYYSIQLNTCGTFCNTQLLQKFGYPTNLYVDSEDTFLITEVILEKKAYAVLCGKGEYRYRKRLVGDSLTQVSGDKKAWYSEKVDNFFFPLINYSKEKYGKTLRYLQFMFRYIMQWNIKYNCGQRNVLSVEETEEYLNKLRNILLEIDDEILTNRINDKKIDSSVHLNNMLLNCKYGQNLPVRYLYKSENMYMTLEDEMLYTIKEHGINIQAINFCEDKIYISGFYTNPFLNADIKLKVEINDEEVEFKIIKSELYSVKYFGKTASQGYEFQVAAIIQEDMQIKFYFCNDHINYLVPLITNKSPYNKLYTKCAEDYYFYENTRLEIGKKGICLKRAESKEKFKCEVKYLKRLLFGKKLLRKKSTNIKAVIMRCIYWATHPVLKKKKIWLFMDRMNKGGDNAEFLFRYSMKQKDEIAKYFVVNKETETYKYLKREHLPVVAKGSLKHRLLLFNCDKFITSQMDVIYMNDLRGIEIFFRDLLNFDYIHIQHGLCWQNLEHLLNPNIENLKMITAVAHNEVKNLNQERYGYLNNQLHPVGMARFDGLCDKSKEIKQVMICPTWRRDLVGRLKPDGEREYSDKFKKSKFFEIYNSMLSDEKFISFAEKAGYKIIFVLHPNLQQQRGDFNIDERVLFPKAYEVDYDYLLKQSKLMVTDYSGIQFDFAYMQKPLIYYHDASLPNHLETSEFFDYEKDGFGEICTSADELKESIKKYIKNDAQMEQQYIERVEKFFIFHDFNNCKRIYEEILQYSMGIV